MAKSKYEIAMQKRRDAEEDEAKVIERSFIRASNVVKQQIAALEVKRTDLQIEVEEAQEDLLDATYTEHFSIAVYDEAKEKVDDVEEQLADVEATLKARKELLESWE